MCKKNVEKLYAWLLLFRGGSVIFISSVAGFQPMQVRAYMSVTVTTSI